MKKAILMATVLILTLTGVGFAGQRGFGPGMNRGSMLMPPGPWWEQPKLSQSLTITDAEKEKLENLFFGHRKGMIDLRGEAKKARLDLEQLMRSDTFNAEAGNAGFKRLQDARNTLAAERFKYIVAVRELLGADRYRKLKTETRKFRMKGKRSRRDGAKGRRMAYMQEKTEN
jgi:Spy/CpxP family protein refolding chaperone